MSEQPVEIPPQRHRTGCCGTGCFTFLTLIVFLALASVGGVFWGIHHLQEKYLAKEPLAMPEVITSDEPAAVDNNAPVESAPASAAPTPVPARVVEQNWKTFEKAKDRNENARVELSAGEINALLQSHKNTRGKAFVSIENNVAHVRVSIPLKHVPLMSGRYLNGEATVEASPDGDPKKARLTNIVLAGSSVPDSVVDRRLFSWSSIRNLALGWLSEQGITSFRIENNRVIGEKGGG